MNTPSIPGFTVGLRAGALRVVLLLFVSAIALMGCDDKRRHQTSEEVAFKVIEPAAGADASPEAIATEALAAMRDLQRVRAEGLGKGDNRAKYEEAMGRIFGLADQDRIYDMMKPDPTTNSGSPFSPTDLSKDAAVRKIAESWTSKTAYYIDGVELATIQVLTPSAKGEERRVVTVVAVNADEVKKLAAIRSQSGMGAADVAFENLTPEQQGKIRTAAIAEGFNVPIEARIRMVVAKTKSGWRVQKVDLVSAG
ncbi:MAG: hypothetical protein KDA33_17260 [Phycisphaerales bacterium]|nr:hypothetical protein [Phycisphaerales bacterium]